MKRPENGLFAGFGLSPNSPQETPNDIDKTAKSIGLYAKCLDCQDYGVVCNGPKLAALGDIMTVRDFHRAIRDQRHIHLKDIYKAAHEISEYTINDYFSNSEKDFKWTTVGTIDNALTAICGNRVGLPPMDNPCPASSTEIQQKQEQAENKYRDLELEYQKLNGKLEVAEETKQKALAEQEQSFKNTIEYLKDLSERRFKLLLSRDRVILVISILGALCFAGLACYIGWDLMHGAEGLFRFG